MSINENENMGAYPGNSPYAGQPGTTGGPPLSTEATPEEIEESIPDIESPENRFGLAPITPLSVPDATPLPLSSVDSGTLFTRYWGDLRDAANRTWDAVKYGNTREEVPALSSQEAYESPEAYDRWAEQVQEQQAMDTEAMNNFRSIPDLVSQWTQDTSDEVTGMFNQVRRQWAEHQVNKVKEMGRSIQSSYTEYVQTVKKRVAPYEYAKMVRDFELELPMHGRERTPYPDYKGFLRGIGWNDTALNEILLPVIQQVWEENPDSSTDFYLERASYDMTDTEWKTHQRMGVNILQEALHRVKKDVVEQQLKMDDPMEWGTARMQEALASMGSMDWLDAHPDIIRTRDEELNAILTGQGLGLLDNIIEQVDDVDPETGTPTLFIGMLDILEGDALRDAHKFSNHYDPKAVEVRAIGDAAIGAALGKYIGSYAGADVSDITSVKVGSQIQQAGQILQDLAQTVLPPELVENFFEGASTFTLPHLMMYLKDQHEALMNRDDLTGEQWLYLQENGGTLGSIFSQINETIEAETQKLQLHQLTIQQANREIAYREQQMNNPEYIRNSYLARRYKELGIEDPTGNNWEEIDTEQGIENTWEEATRIVHAQAMDGEFGLFGDYAALEAFETSLKIGEIVSRKAPKPAKDGINERIRIAKRNADSGHTSSQNTNLIWMLIGGDAKVTDALSGANPNPDVLSRDNVNNITKGFDSLLSMYNGFLRESVSEGMAENIGMSSLPGGFTLEKALVGEWGVDLERLNTAELYAWSRTLQAMSKDNPTSSTPDAVKQVGAILVERLTYLDGKQPNSKDPITPKQKALALGAARTLVGLQLGSADGRNISIDQFLADTPRHMRKLLGGISGMVSRSMLSSGKYDLQGLSMDELIIRFNAGEPEERDSIEIIERDETGKEVGRLKGIEAINAMFEEYNGAIQVLSDALYHYEHNPEGSELYTAHQRDAGNAVKTMASPRFRINRPGIMSGDPTGEALTVLGQLSSAGLTPTQYTGTIDLTPAGKDGDMDDDNNTIRLASILRSHPLLSPGLEGDKKAMEAGEAEARALRVLATNPQARSMMEALIYSRQANGVSYSETLDILSDTLDLMGANHLKMVRTGPGDEDIAIFTAPPDMNDTDWHLLPGRWDKDTDSESVDETSKIGVAFQYRGPYVPITNRNQNTWDQFVVPHMKRSRDIAGPWVAQTLGIPEDDPIIIEVLNQIEEEERQAWLNSARTQAPDRGDAGKGVSTLVDDSLRGADRAKLGIMTVGATEAAIAGAKVGRAAGEALTHSHLSDEVRNSWETGQEFLPRSVQDVLLGALDRVSLAKAGSREGRASQWNKLDLILTQGGLGGKGRRYGNVRFDLGRGSILTETEIGTTAPPSWNITMSVGDQVQGTPDSYKVQFAPGAVDSIIKASLATARNDTALVKFYEKADGAFNFFWNQLWDGAIPEWEMPEEINNFESSLEQDLAAIDKLAEEQRKESPRDDAENTKTDEEFEEMRQEAIRAVVAKHRWISTTKDWAAAAEELDVNRVASLQHLLYHQNRGDSPEEARRKAEERLGRQGKWSGYYYHP